MKTRYRPAVSDVLVLHALDLLSPYAGMTALDPSMIEHLTEGERRTAEAPAKRAEQGLPAAGFRASSKLKEGDAPTVILEAASEWQADRIVFGSHGRGAADPLMLGGVSLPIARHAPRSVEIVRGRFPAPSRKRRRQPGVRGPWLAGRSGITVCALLPCLLALPVLQPSKEVLKNNNLKRGAALRPGGKCLVS